MNNKHTQVQTVFASGWTSLHCNATRSPSEAGYTGVPSFENNYKCRPSLFAEWIKTHPKTTVKMLAEAFAISYTTAAQTARNLLDKKVIIDEPEINARNIFHFYSINPAQLNKH